VGNGIEINTGKNKAIRFTGTWVKIPMDNSLGDQKFRKCKCK
jgi:hypothetical protein